MFFVLAVPTAKIQDYISFFELFCHVLFDLFDDFVMEIEAKTIVSLLHVFLLYLKRLHFL